MIAGELAKIEGFARWTSRRWPGLAFDDVRQEAVLVTLERGGRFGPIQQAEASRRLRRGLLAVSVPLAHAPVGVEWADLGPAPLPVRAVEKPGHASPEEIHLAARAEALRVAIARAERLASRGLPSFVRTCGERAAAGRYHGMHVDLARELDLTPRQVVGAIGRYSRVVGANLRVVELRRLLAVVLADLGSP